MITVSQIVAVSFYSAPDWQPLLIHKTVCVGVDVWVWGVGGKGGGGANIFASGNLAEKTISTVHHTLNFVYKFLRDTS